MNNSSIIQYISLAVICFLGSCSPDKNKASQIITPQSQEQKSTTSPSVYKSYGDVINDEKAQDIGVLVPQLAKSDSVPAKIRAKVVSVCQNKGCWMKLALDSGGQKQLRVSFKDYGFFVPKDISGKTVILQGYASMDTIGVDALRHYAQDAGKSKAEIAKITMPEITPSFEATGVLVLQK